MTQRASIISAIESGAHRSREIAGKTGISLAVVQVRLAELQSFGVVRSYRLRNAGRGQVKHYRLETAA